MPTYREWFTQDKSKYPLGPWTNEPDKIQYIDPKTNYPCLIKRNLALCGYVGVTENHPAYGKGYGDELLSGISVHGGLTFASRCQEISNKSWEDMKLRLKACEAEAIRYPKGDAANLIKTWSKCLNNYDLFVEQCHAELICHIPEPNTTDNIWWLGFDCGHLGDLCPPRLELPQYAEYSEVYRNVEYVKLENAKLAHQLKMLETNNEPS